LVIITSQTIFQAEIVLIFSLAPFSNPKSNTEFCSINADVNINFLTTINRCLNPTLNTKQGQDKSIVDRELYFDKSIAIDKKCAKRDDSCDIHNQLTLEKLRFQIMQIPYIIYYDDVEIALKF